MAIGRQQQFYGQGRVDVPHLRALDSGVAYDIDVLMGAMLCGNRPLVVSGFETSTVGVPGIAATSLQIAVAGALLAHPLATDAGTILQVPSNRAAEVLNTSNARLVGSFTASAVNYIGIDLFRTQDSTTADIIQFIDETTNQENAQQLPLAATYDYTIYISTQDFSVNPNLLPILKVTTDSLNNVLSVEDARNMMWRLGGGGSLTTPLNTYSWPAGRTEVGNNSDFHVADKVIPSLKDWANAVMTRLWEVGGGEHWYSATSDHNVMMVRNGTTLFSNGDYFEWTGSNVHWRELRFLLPNTTGIFNDVADQLTDNAGQTDLADGQCVYVDLDPTTTHTGGTALVGQKGTTATVGSPLIPGTRYIIAWRVGSNIYTRGNQWAVGTTFNPATTSAIGMVKLLQTPGAPGAPVVLNQDANGGLTYAASGGNRTALIVTGNGSGAGVSGTGGGTSGTGVFGQGGAGTGVGVSGFGGGNGPGVLGAGAGTGSGGDFTGGATGAAVATHGVASNNAPQVYAQNSGGRVRGILADHNGLPTWGSVGMFREDWSVPVPALSANTNPIASTNGKWQFLQASSGTLAQNTGTNQYPGCAAVVQSSTTAGSLAVLYSTINVINTSPTFLDAVFEWDVILNGNLVGTGNNVACYTQLDSGGSADLSASTTYIQFSKTNASNNWFCRVSSGGTASTNTDTGVIAGSVGATRLRVEFHGSTTTFGAATVILFVNGQQVAIFNNASQIPLTTLSLGFMAKSPGPAVATSISVGSIMGVWNTKDSPTAL